MNSTLFFIFPHIALWFLFASVTSLNPWKALSLTNRILLINSPCFICFAGTMAAQHTLYYIDVNYLFKNISVLHTIWSAFIGKIRGGKKYFQESQSSPDCQLYWWLKKSFFTLVFHSVPLAFSSTQTKSSMNISNFMAKKG